MSYIKNGATTIHPLEAPRPRTELSTHVLCPAVPFATEHVHLPGELDAATEAPGNAAALWVTESPNGGRGEAARITLLAPSDLQRRVRPEDVQVTSVLMAPSLVPSLASYLARGDEANQMCHAGLRMVDPPAAAMLWRDTVRYVKTIVLADDVVAAPVLATSAAKLLAAVAQAAYPLSDATLDARDTRCDRPALLRRAVEFIEAHVAEDISLGDVAEAIHVTPRAVQYMFRKHLDTTPLQYLRQIRLHYAHLDLLAADRRWETVTAVATRWGFSHTGRFAVAYRQSYGQSPHTTLRD